MIQKLNDYILTLSFNSSDEKELFLKQTEEIFNIANNEIGLDESSVLVYSIYYLYDKKLIDIKSIEKVFGSNIAFLLDKFIKISVLHTRKASINSDNFRKLLMSLAQDIRVLLLKLTERLSQIRNLESFDENDRSKIIEECNYLYAPLAHRLGLYKIKTELEDRCMQYYYKLDYDAITKKIQDTKEEREIYIANFIAPIDNIIRKQGIEFNIKGRTKAIPSIWSKMKKQQIEIDEIFDLFAIRIIIDCKAEEEKEYCWKVYSLITNVFTPDTKRLRDWVSVPKETGYESLHTTVLGPEDKWVEVQIRTARMDEIAEKGVAAHWKYKSQKKLVDDETWFAKIRELLEKTSSVAEADSLNIEADNIYIFTPEGDLKELRNGSTVLDFAFDIHTNVGFSCTGARLNNKIVPIRHKLSNGDMVEIITAKNQKPKKDWLEYVTSPRAKNKIKKALKEELFLKSEEGKEIIQKKLAQLKIEFSDENIRKLMKHFKVKDHLELFHFIAENNFSLSEIKLIFFPELKVAEQIHDTQKVYEIPVKHSSKKGSLEIDEQSGFSDYKLSKCCNPVFGDDIFGFITIGAGIKIHRNNCPNGNYMKEKFDYRIVKAKWIKSDDGARYNAIVRITGNDRIGIMKDITKTLSGDLHIDMRALSAGSDAGTFFCTAEIVINDTAHLESVIAKIKRIKGIVSVSRAEI